MEIQKLNAAIEQTGYNPSGVKGDDKDEDAQIFAQENGISVEEAKNILKTAEEKAEENDKIMAQEAALMAELLNDQDEEEEINIIEDEDFDTFLKQDSPEQKMQDLLIKQQYAKQDDNSAKEQNNPFSNDDNPFLNMKW